MVCAGRQRSELTADSYLSTQLILRARRDEREQTDQRVVVEAIALIPDRLPERVHAGPVGLATEIEPEQVGDRLAGVDPPVGRSKMVDQVNSVKGLTVGLPPVAVGTVAREQIEQQVLPDEEGGGVDP